MPADRCLIPFDCDDFSRRALYNLLESVDEVREDHNPKLKVGGVVVNQFQARARLPQLLVDELRGEGLPILEPYISASVKVRESHGACETVAVSWPGRTNSRASLKSSTARFERSEASGWLWAS